MIFFTIFFAVVSVVMIIMYVSQLRNNIHFRELLKTMSVYVSEDKHKQSEYVQALLQSKAEISDLLCDTTTLREMNSIPGHLMVYHIQSLTMIHDTLQHAHDEVYKSPQGIENASEAESEKARKASQRKIRIRIPGIN